jgi:hypothetical protein
MFSEISTIAKKISIERKGYDHLALFKDSRVQSALKKHGYFVTDFFLPPGVIAELEEAYRSYADLDRQTDDEKFYSSGSFMSSAAANFATGQIREIFLPELKKILREDAARAEPSVFQIKPASDKSNLTPHQDSIIVDEEKHMAICAWVCLVDSNMESGALYVLPGSHRFGTGYRCAMANSPFEYVQDIIMKYSKVVEAKAGQVVLFDSAIIHGSLMNKSGKVRVAASGLVIPREAEIIVSITDHKTPKDTVDIYKLNEDYFLNNNTTDPDSTAKTHVGDFVGNFALSKLGLSRFWFSILCRLNALRLFPFIGRLRPN